MVEISTYAEPSEAVLTDNLENGDAKKSWILERNFMQWLKHSL